MTSIITFPFRYKNNKRFEIYDENRHNSFYEKFLNQIIHEKRMILSLSEY